MRFKHLFIALLLALFGSSQGALACSVWEGYSVPSSSEMVNSADFIVLAEVIGSSHSEHTIAEEGEIWVKPTLLLKGRHLPGPFKMMGYQSGTVISGGVDGSKRARVGNATPSNPMQLLGTHPEAGAGMCSRNTYNKGMILLLFLTEKDGQLSMNQGAFSRDREEVPSANAPWVRAIKEYIAVENLPKAAQKAALLKRADALRQTEVAEDRVIADELDWNYCRYEAGPLTARCAALSNKAEQEMFSSSDWQQEYDILPDSNARQTKVNGKLVRTIPKYAHLMFPAILLIFAGAAFYFYRKIP